MGKKMIVDKYMSRFRKNVSMVVVFFLIIAFISGAIAGYGLVNQFCNMTGFAFTASCIAGGILGGAFVCFLLNLLFALTIPSVMVMFDMKDQITRIADGIDGSSEIRDVVSGNKPKEMWVSHAVAPERKAEDKTEQKDCWTCRYCGYLNEWYWEKCHACGKRK